MLAGIFDVNLDTFDYFAVVAGILLVVAAVLARPVGTPRPPAAAYATMIAYIGLAVFAFGFLFMTP